jgi:hypothetical protein
MAGLTPGHFFGGSPMKKQFAAVFLLFFVACSAVQNAPSLGEAIAAGYVTVETLAESALLASQTGQIDSNDRARVRVALQTAKDALDTGADLLLAGRRNDVLAQLTIAYEYFESVRLTLGESE